MPTLSEITITPDMMRKHWAMDIVPFGLKDVCGLIAGCLCGAGLCSWLIVLFARSLGG